MARFLGKADWLMCCRTAALVYLRDSVWQPSSQAPSKAIQFLSRQKALRGYGSNISSGSRVGGNAELVRFLSSEMVLVRDAYKSRKEAKKGISKLAPFSLKGSPGLRHVVLHRTYKQEDITIKCLHESDSHEKHLQHETMEDDEYVQKKLFCEGLLKMKVKIFKGLNDSILEIDCTFAGRDAYFERISCGDTNDEKRHSYAGPRSGDVADELQIQFEQFLAVRGITLELAVEVAEEIALKNDREYFLWLKNVRSFLKE